MDKHGELQAGVTICDLCSAKAEVFDGQGGAYCRPCSTVKRASESHRPLKSAAPVLAPKHEVPRAN